jgi:hypothetical protein
VELDRIANGGVRKTTLQKTKIFGHEVKEMLKRHWLLCIYAVLLMTGEHFRTVGRGTNSIIGFNFLSHGSQVGPIISFVDCSISFPMPSCRASCRHSRMASRFRLYIHTIPLYLFIGASSLSCYRFYPHPQ